MPRDGFKKWSSREACQGSLRRRGLEGKQNGPVLREGRFFTKAYASDTLLNLSLLRWTVNFALECSVHSNEGIEEVTEVIRSNFFQMLDEFFHLSFPLRPRHHHVSLYAQCSAE
jgi:hypothetical protein